MKFGLVLPNYGSQATRYSILDSAISAENLGFDSIWLTDHLALPSADANAFGHIYESMTTLAYLAASTRSIKLGLSTLVLPQRNPLEVAKAIATVDNLSGGRLIISVGIGWSKGEYKNLGYEFHNRGKRMNEAVKILRTCWRGQTNVHFQGDYYSFDDVFFSPTPVQSGGPPLWIAGDSHVALKRAIGLGDGWHPNGNTAEHLQKTLKPAKSIIQVRPFTVAVRLNVSITKNEQAEQNSGITGSTEEIIRQFSDYKIAGMNYAIINFKVSSQAERERVMKQFMHEIAPSLVE